MPVLLTGDLLEGLVAVPVGGGRARAGLEIDHSEPQARVWRSRGRAAAHGHIKQPEQAKPAAASSVGGGQIQGFDGRLEGGGCLLVLV